MGKQIIKSLMLGALAGVLVFTAKPEMVVADTVLSQNICHKVDLK